jgi:hypothetical protein
MVTGGDAALRGMVVAWSAGVMHDFGGYELQGVLAVEGGCLVLRASDEFKAHPVAAIGLPDTVRVAATGPTSLVITGTGKYAGRTVATGETLAFGVMTQAPSLSNTRTPARVDIPPSCSKLSPLVYYWAGFP